MRARSGRGPRRVGQAEVGGHARDHDDLLCILASEVGTLGTDQREQDGHHGRDAFEVTGPRGTLERPRHGADVTLVSKPGG